MMRAFLSLICLLPCVAFAADSITVGTLTLTPTFQNIGCVLTYTGDDDGDATFTSYWRRSGQTLWRTNYHNTNLIDRAATRGGSDNTANRFQARFDVIGTLANTTYEVYATLTDPDGGTASVTNTVTTLAYSYDRPTNGTIITCTSSDTLATKINALNAGETLNVETHTYSGNFTVTVSGTPSAWIVIQNAPGNTPTIGGGAFANIISATGRSNLIFRGFAFGESQQRVFNLSGCQDIFIENCTAPAIGSSESANSAFVYVVDQRRIFVLGNSFANHDTTPPSDSHGIQFSSGTPSYQIVCQSNVIQNFWDGIGGGGNVAYVNGAQSDCDFIGNSIGAIGAGSDDRLEMEGGGINCRAYGNYFWGVAEDALGIAPILTGPAYVLKNIILMTNGSGIKQGNNSDACHILEAHNTIVTVHSSSSGFTLTGEWGGTPRSKRTWHLNSIYSGRGNGISQSGTTNYWDYNHYYHSTGGNIVEDFNDNTSADYATLAAFQSATIYEDNGSSGDPDIIDYPTAQIDTDSPCKDTGTIIIGINDRWSRWPFGGTAPDKGAYEINAGAWDQGLDPVDDIVATTVSSTQIEVTWLNQTVADSGFECERALDSAFSSSPVLTGGIAVDAASFTASSLTAGTTYYFRVRGTNSLGVTPWFGPVSATTSATAGGVTARPAVETLRGIRINSR